MTADKMFEKLGYCKSEVKYEVGLVSRYYKNCDDFSNEDYGLTNMNFWNDKSFNKYNDLTTTYITFDELQAINQKCKELGWTE